MSTDRTRESGLTLVEVVIALGLSGLGLLALMTTSEYFQKSKLVIETRTTHANLRNQIFIALSQKLRDCAGANCTTREVCRTNLRSKSGAAFALPTGIAASLSTNAPLPILETDAVELNIAQSSQVPGTPPRQIVVSSNDPNNPTPQERDDRLLYDVRLTAEVKTIDPDFVTYAGFVHLRGNRALIGRNDVLHAQVPIELKMNRATKALEECDTRSSERMIFGGQNSLDDCTVAGGMPVPSPYGQFCRFRSKPRFAVSSTICPPGFTGSNATTTGCTVDLTANSDLMSTIPPCPPINMKNGTAVNGVVDATMNKGNMYCNYQGALPGVAGTTELEPCPDDPEWLANPVPPRLGWDDAPAPAPPYDLTTNLRRCKYDFQCPAPNETIVLAPPAGDGKTPTCKFKITSCPNSNPPANPPVWVQIQANPLRCRLNSAYVPGSIPPVATCPTGFTPVPASFLSAHNELNQWNATVGTGMNAVAHILCM